jgi:hypothetical protein
VAEWAGPRIHAVREAFIGPSEVLKDMVVPAARRIVARTGGTTVGIRRCVVYVAIGGWHAASRE